VSIETRRPAKWIRRDGTDQKNIFRLAAFRADPPRKPSDASRNRLTCRVCSWTRRVNRLTRAVSCQPAAFFSETTPFLSNLPRFLSTRRREQLDASRFLLTMARDRFDTSDFTPTHPRVSPIRRVSR
jgi:hypothetical protein